MNFYLEAALWIGGAAITGGGAAYLARRFGTGEGGAGNNDATGQVFTIISGLHAVLVAFILITLFDTARESREVVQDETNAVVQASWAAESLPDETAERVRILGRDYLNTVLRREWPKMRSGAELTDRGADQLARLHLAVAATPITTDDEYYARQKAETATKIEQVYEARQQRLTRIAHSSLSAVVWFALILGGVISTLLPNLFGGTKLVPHVVIVSTLAGTIALLLFAIYQLQNPFGPASNVDPDAVRTALRLLR